MDIGQIRAIKAEAMAAKGRLRSPYVALKTMMAEQTGFKTRQCNLRCSEADIAIAQELADNLGISVGALYRQLAAIAHKDWKIESEEREDARQWAE